MTTISLSDIEALADRLIALGRRLNDIPNLQADLLLTGRLLQRLIQDGTIWGSVTLDR
jgi:hypothetical protein